MQTKYIVEHLDELEEWCALEYIHICEIIKDENAIFTKFDKQFSDISSVHKPTCYEKPIRELRHLFDWNKVCLLDMKAKDILKCEDKDKINFLLFGGILGNVPSDDRTSELRKLNFPLSRNLGNMQMTTNTAVLVCYIILNDKVQLEDIPFVDNPEVVLRNNKESMILPFRFVSMYYYTKCESDKTVPVLPRNFKDYLIRLGDQQYDDVDMSVF
ncbi:SAM-dependent RNA methyltransferase, putative [Plasmodium malariae]|uniref:SAM-dependent RNA methyltransferase, putative n=1 Tax=Plasmodium malariae TaxID=5858 RepID=A0A1C3L0M9_PLAMA|nr:SAM-dependent RNA methyltransferase, putative [Plasmodium malariae]